MKSRLALFLLFICATQLQAQYAPAAGQVGSTAIYKDNACFVAWANSCNLERGWLNILDSTLGKSTVGDANSCIGAAGENGVVSLGDGGRATVQFQNPIYNGPGYDFAIFENSFRDDFLELAFVEVSSDGIIYKRFPATSLIDTSVQVDSFGLIDCRQINNLAGKYRALYGTPFDLEELALYSDIDIMNIRFVRLIDVVGTMMDSYASRDKDGRKINDPFPTPYPSSGFDLDAVGVIHSRGMNSITDNNMPAMRVYPTLLGAGQNIHIENMQAIEQIRLVDMQGNEVNAHLIDKEIFVDAALRGGLYILQVQADKQWNHFKIIVE